MRPSPPTDRASSSSGPTSALRPLGSRTSMRLASTPAATFSTPTESPCPLQQGLRRNPRWHSTARITWSSGATARSSAGGTFVRHAWLPTAPFSIRTESCSPPFNSFRVSRRWPSTAPTTSSSSLVAASIRCREFGWRRTGRSSIRTGSSSALRAAATPGPTSPTGRANISSHGSVRVGSTGSGSRRGVRSSIPPASRSRPSTPREASSTRSRPMTARISSSRGRIAEPTRRFVCTRREWRPPETCSTRRGFRSRRRLGPRSRLRASRSTERTPSSLRPHPAVSKQKSLPLASTAREQCSIRTASRSRTSSTAGTTLRSPLEQRVGSRSGKTGARPGRTTSWAHGSRPTASSSTRPGS